MKIQVLFIFFLNLNLCNAQNFDLGSWNIFNVKYSHDDKSSFFGEAQIRSLKFYNNFHYYEFKGGMNYKFNKNIGLTLGAGTYQTFKEGGNFVIPKNNNEFRVWPQVILNQFISGFTIEQRYRTELRFTSNGFRNRYRYRIGLSYPFGKVQKQYKPFQVNISNEIFFTNKEPYFERNRLLLGFNYKPTKAAIIQLGYLHQFDYKTNDETGRDFFHIGYNIEFFSKNAAN